MKSIRTNPANHAAEGDERYACVHCGHHHYGEPDEDGTQWCDVVICGDGCCHCACYTPVYRNGPRLLGRNQSAAKSGGMG